MSTSHTASVSVPIEAYESLRNRAADHDALLPALKADATRYRNALANLVGLIDLILIRNDLPAELRKSLNEHWRLLEARELLSDEEKVRG